MPLLRVWTDPRVPFPAIVDSGADRSCLPLGIAIALGIPFDKAVTNDGVGVSGSHKFWTASQDVDLSSDAGPIRLTTPNINENLPVILLGRCDVFLEYKIAFDERAQSFTMTPYKESKLR